MYNLKQKKQTMSSDNFLSRHIGPRDTDIDSMLSKIGVSSLDELIDQTIPSNIRLKEPLKIGIENSDSKESNVPLVVDKLAPSEVGTTSEAERGFVKEPLLNAPLALNRNNTCFPLQLKESLL